MIHEELSEGYTAILALEQMLTDAEIRHRIDRCLDGWRIAYPDEEHLVCSVIEHRGSIGSRGDRLEIMGLLNREERKFDRVVGCLTAENVFGRIQRDWERNRANGHRENH